MAPASTRRPDYERSDADPRLLLALAAGVAVFLVATPYVLSAIYPAVRREPPVRPAEPPPAPRLQIDPRADLAALRASENERLSAYGWIDRSAASVHIPIARAIQLTAERGLPEWPKP
jgi:hypothetical protein